MMSWPVHRFIVMGMLGILHVSVSVLLELDLGH